MDRIEQGDQLLLKAIEQLEKDPQGTLSVLRSIACATIAQGLLMREMLDQGSVTIELPEDDDEGPRPPW